MPFSQETKQALFDEAAKAILKQGSICKATGSKTNCVYSDNDGRHCAIGHLLVNRGISLDGLDEDGESTGVDSAISVFNEGEDSPERYYRLLDGLCSIGADSITDLRFLEELQKAHDECDDMGHYRLGMKRLAGQAGLSDLALT